MREPAPALCRSLLPTALRASSGRAGKLSGDKGGSMETGALSVEVRSPAACWPRFKPSASSAELGLWKNMEDVLVKVFVRPANEPELVLPNIGLSVDDAAIELDPVADVPAAAAPAPPL